ncbi:MAG: class I SAM-dependent methyltransferase, partial [Saprospiraceae bacterium]
ENVFKFIFQNTCMNTREILGILRTAGLIQLVDKFRFAWEYVRHYPVNRHFLSKHRGQAFPPPYMLYEAFRMDYQKYWESGQATARWIQSVTAGHLPVGVALDILDWGCGPARVLRHLPGVFGEGHRCRGADYNPLTVAWCREQAGLGQVTLCPSAPPCPYDTGTFDLIYGISVFTHLPESAHYRWREELLRIAKPGGILFLTLQGPAFLGKLQPFEQQLFTQGKPVFRGKTRAGHRTFSAFHPEPWARDFFAGQFEVITYLPGGEKPWGIEQDVWLLRKPQETFTPPS